MTPECTINQSIRPRFLFAKYWPIFQINKNRLTIDVLGGNLGSKYGKFLQYGKKLHEKCPISSSVSSQISMATRIPHWQLSVQSS